MDAADLDRIAEQLFANFVAWDLDAVAQMLAPDAVITQNGRSAPGPEALATIGSLRAVAGDHHYEDVRRTTGDHTVVEEHRVVSVTPAGVPLDLPACVVIRVNADGQITAIDEYVDTAPLLR